MKTIKHMGRVAREQVATVAEGISDHRQEEEMHREEGEEFRAFCLQVDGWGDVPIIPERDRDDGVDRDILDEDDSCYDDC